MAWPPRHDSRHTLLSSECIERVSTHNSAFHSNNRVQLVHPCHCTLQDNGLLRLCADPYLCAETRRHGDLATDTQHEGRSRAWSKSFVPGGWEDKLTHVETGVLQSGERVRRRDLWPHPASAPHDNARDSQPNTGPVTHMEHPPRWRKSDIEYQK